VPNATPSPRYRQAMAHTYDAASSSATPKPAPPTSVTRAAWNYLPNSGDRTWIRVRVRGVTLTVVSPFEKPITGLGGRHPTGPHPGPGQGF
jgi:hypothetical protein